MALIPRIKVQGDVDRVPALAAVVAVLSHFSERFNAGPGHDMYSPDAIAIDHLHDVMIAQLRRTSLDTPVKVQRHVCPHVPGFAEPSWQPCTSAAYDYSETVI